VNISYRVYRSGHFKDCGDHALSKMHESVKNTFTLRRPPATIVEHELYLQIPAVLTQKTSRSPHYRCYTKTWDHTATLCFFLGTIQVTKQVYFHRGVRSGVRDNMSHPNSSLFRHISMAERLAQFTTEGDPWSIPGAGQNFYLLLFSFLFFGYPWWVWAGGVINPEVLMQKHCFLI
jgi:hypothetical protein